LRSLVVGAGERSPESRISEGAPMLEAVAVNIVVSVVAGEPVLIHPFAFAE